MFDVHLTRSPPFTDTANCLVVAVCDARRLSACAQLVDRALDGLISVLLERGSISGESGQVLSVPLLNNHKAEYLLIVGCGTDADRSDREYRRILAAAFQELVRICAQSACIYLGEVAVRERDEHWKIRQQVEAAAAACYRVNSLKTRPDNKARNSLAQITLWGDESNREAVSRGLAVASGVRKCRDLGNLPANICTPAYLVEQAQQLAMQHEGLSTTALGEEDMQALGMGALLSVGAGSAQPSQLIVMHYRGGREAQRPHVLVGKGITFDTGGICLKGRDGMKLMKYDMGGAAAVIGAMAAAAELGLRLNIVGIVACAENMPGSRATKPTDVVTSMSGQTVEVLNTDAEGRLVLCDALTYAERFEPASVVDVATLTGASMIALGRHYSALFANDAALADKLLAAGQRAMDKAWQLPLSPEDMAQLDTEFADIANIGDGSAGCVVAALFLSRFSRAYPWAHLDISATAKQLKPGIAATGRPVPLLVQYLIDRHEELVEET